MRVVTEKVYGALEVDVHADGFDQHRAAVLVVAGMIDELQVKRVVDSAPGVQVVVALEDVFAGVVQVAVAQQKAQAAIAQIVLVIALDGVRDEGDAELVVGARAGVAGVVAAEGDSLVDLGVGEGLVLAFVPADACEDAEICGQLLLGVEAEAVFDGAELRVLCDVRRRDPGRRDRR